nr:sugar ABC transporter permease [Conexibacter woesei]
MSEPASDALSQFAIEQHAAAPADRGRRVMSSAGVASGRAAAARRTPLWGRLRARVSPRDGVPPGEPRRVAYLYVLPALVLFAPLVLFPLAETVWFSFYSWSGVGPSRPVGLENYRAVFENPQISSAFVHSGVLIVFFSLMPIVWGLLLSAALSRFRVRGLTFFRVILFLPQVLATVVVATSWQWILAYDGPLNAFLRFLGLGSLVRPWLGDYGTALPAVGLIGGWVMFGFCMVLFLAAIQEIPRSLYEAARVDGAGPVREFLTVTLPGVRNQLAVALTVTVIGALNTFDLVYVLTQGGPGTQTVVPGYLVYQQAFANGDIGSGSAIAVMLTLAIFVVAVVINRVAER